MRTLAELRPARAGLMGQRWLLYGPPKIGKSTFAASAPGNPLFLDCEDGTGFFDAYSMPITSWPKAMETIRLIAAGDHDHKTIVIDTVDRFVAMASDYVLAELNASSKTPLAHISDAGFGKGYARLAQMLDAALHQLAGHGRLILFLSHESIEKKDGATQPMVVKPSTSRSNQVLGFCDVIGHVELAEDGERRIRFRSAAGIVAGARGKGDAPLLPPVLPMSWDAISNHIAGKPVAKSGSKP